MGEWWGDRLLPEKAQATTKPGLPVIDGGGHEERGIKGSWYEESQKRGTAMLTGGRARARSIQGDESYLSRLGEGRVLEVTVGTTAK